MTVLGAVGAWWFKHRKAPAPVVAKNTIAVLPLQNMTGDSSMDYLRFALADEIASVLTYNRTLDVRPTASTRKYVSADTDPQQAGRELLVANVVTGHFMRQGNQLLVTLQSVNVGTDSVSWQSAPDHGTKSGLHRAARGANQAGPQWTSSRPGFRHGVPRNQHAA